MSTSKILALLAVICFVLAGFGVALPVVGHAVEFGLALLAASFVV